CYLILIWTYGIYIFTKKQAAIDWRRLFLNPGILSTLLGLLMMFMPFHWPQTVIQTFEDVGKMTIPLSMILIGSLLAEISWSDFRQYIKNVYIWSSSCFSLLFYLLSFLVFFFFIVCYL